MRSTVCASPLPAACHPAQPRNERRAAAPADSAGASYVFGEDPQRVAAAAGAVLPLAVLAPAEVLRCLVAEAVCNTDKARAAPLRNTPACAGAGRLGMAALLVSALERPCLSACLTLDSTLQSCLCACTARSCLTALQAGSAGPDQG